MSERPMHVVQVLPAMQAGGVERGTVEVAEALVEAGHRASVISAGGPMAERMTRQCPEIEHLTVPIGVKSPWTVRHVPRLRGWFGRHRPDIVHARSRLPAWVAWLALRGLDPVDRPRFLTTAHGFYSVSRYSAIMARGERVIAVSEAIRDYLLTSYPRDVRAADIEVIHRGVDRRQYYPGFQPDGEWMSAWRARYPAGGTRRYVVLPARLTRLKGHLDFIEAIANLRTRGVDAHGLIVGGEDPRRRSYAREVRAKIEQLGLGAHIDPLGHRDDLREILAVCDLSVSMSSQPESFGRTVLEGLALGRPVVGFDHGGVAEILRAMYPVGAVAPGDLAGVVEAAHASLMTPSPITAAPQFDLARMLEHTVRLYRSLLEPDLDAARSRGAPLASG